MEQVGGHGLSQLIWKMLNYMDVNYQMIEMSILKSLILNVLT